MCTYMLRLGQISVVICTSVASGTMFQVEAVASSVRITTIPSKGPFRIHQVVQFSCEVEPAESGPVTYQWKNVDYIYGGTSYSRESFNMTFNMDSLRYCWYFCSVSLSGTVLGSADKNLLKCMVSNNTYD